MPARKKNRKSLTSVMTKNKIQKHYFQAKIQQQPVLNGQQ